MTVVQVARLRSDGELAARLLSSKERSLAVLTQKLETQKAAALAVVPVDCSEFATEECQRECVAVSYACGTLCVFVHLLRTPWR